MGSTVPKSRIFPVLKIFLDNTKNYITDRNFEAEFCSIHSCLLLSRLCTRGRVVFQSQRVTFLKTTAPLLRNWIQYDVNLLRHTRLDSLTFWVWQIRSVTKSTQWLECSRRFVPIPVSPVQH